MMTRHAAARVSERTGLTGERAVRFAERAIERGAGSDRVDRWNKDYLEKRSVDGKRAVLYNGYIFILSDDDRCITMWAMDSTKPLYHGKEKIRNVKKHIKMYPRDVDCDDAA